MQQKLTLRMNDAIINQAKHFAHSNKISLSHMVSDYFKSIVTSGRKKESMKKTPVLKELTGIIKSGKSNNDLINQYQTHISDKYL